MVLLELKVLKVIKEPLVKLVNKELSVIKVLQVDKVKLEIKVQLENRELED